MSVKSSPEYRPPKTQRLTLRTVLKVLSEVPFEKIVEFASAIDDLWYNGNGRVFLCGNGGSASTVSHFASDLVTLGVNAICLNDNVSLVTAFTNDFGWNRVYKEQLACYQARAGDILIVASVHGGKGRALGEEWSQNLVRACHYAKYHGLKVLALLGGDGGVIKNLADVSVIVPHDHPYVVEGCHSVITHLVCAVLRRI